MTTTDAVVVQLTEAEALSAAIAGARREIANLYNGRRDAYGADPDQGWQYHILGATAEKAVAKLSGLYWNDDPTRPHQNGDVGELEVRGRTYHKWDLLLHPPDHDDRLYVLVTGLPPVLKVRGCILGRDGKQEQYWGDHFKNGRPCFKVPQSALKPLFLKPLFL